MVVSITQDKTANQVQSIKIFDSQIIFHSEILICINNYQQHALVSCKNIVFDIAKKALLLKVLIDFQSHIYIYTHPHQRLNNENTHYERRQLAIILDKRVTKSNIVGLGKSIDLF